MFFRAIHLKAFGHFEDRVLELGAAPGVVMIVGPNETGKSTLRRAIDALLFKYRRDAPSKDLDGFRHGAAKLRVGATIAADGGAAVGGAVTVYRKPGKINTLRDADDDAIDDAVLERLLGGVTREFFTQVLGLGHDDLREYGNLLLREEGLLGYSLFEAGLGVSAVRPVMTKFRDEAGALFNPHSNAKKHRINAALRDIEMADKVRRSETMRASRWEAVRREADNAEAAAAAVAERLRAAQKEHGRLRRVLESREALNALLMERENLARVADTPLLPEEAAQERSALELDRRTTETERDLAARRRDAARDRLRELAVNPAVLDAADAIRRLVARRGAHIKAMEDRHGLIGQIDQDGDRAKKLIRDCGLDTDLDRVAAEVPGRPVRNALRHLLERNTEHRTRSADRRKRLTDLEKIRDGLRKDHAALPPAADPAALEAVARAVQRQGDLDAPPREAEREATRLRAAAAAAMAALPLFHGSPEALEALRAPMAESCQRAERKIREKAQAEQAQAQRVREIQEQILDKQAQLRDLEAGDPPPGEADLRAARDRRETLWNRIATTLLDAGGGGAAVGDGDRDGDAAPAGADPIAAYRSAVAHADWVVDRLRADVERVSKHAVLTQQIASLEERLQSEQADRKTAETALRTSRTAWAALWRPTGLNPGTPEEMRAWLAERVSVLEAARQAAEAERCAAAKRKRATDAETRLREALAAAEVEVPAGDAAGVQDLLSRARAEVERRQNARRDRQALESKLKTHDAEIVALREEIRVESADQTAWNAEWRDALARGRLPADMPADQAGAVLDLLDDLDAVIQNRDVNRGRVAGIDRDAARFRDDALALATGLLPGGAAESPEETADALDRTLKDNETLRRQRETTREDLDKAETELASLAEDWERQQARAAFLCDRAGCDSLEELPAIEARSREREALAPRVESMERNLRTAWDNMALADIQTAVENENALSLEARVSERAGAVRALQDELEDAHQKVGELRERIAGAGDDTAAARAHQDAAMAEDTVRHAITPYVRRALAAELLRRAVERYRQHHQGPILSRGQDLFARLTGGAFQGLSVENDGKGEPILMGLRREPRESVSPNHMSDGARDQLYLALRLAVIEDHAAKHEPVPFIADDLLINFDDDRARSAFGVLSDLATGHGVQVLFLTHHPHMVGLARAAAPEGALTVCALDPL